MANTNTLYEQIQDATIAVVKGLTLTSDDGTLAIGQQVYGQLTEDESNVLFPCVLVTTEGMRPFEKWGDSEHFGYWYPVKVFVVDHETGRDLSHKADYLAWLQIVFDAFNNQRLAGVAQVQRCFVERGAQFPKTAKMQYLTSGLQFNFYCQIPRVNPAF